MGTVLLKVYGNLWPAPDGLLQRLEPICADAMTQEDDDGIPRVCQEGDLLRISFEGLYFPVDEVLEAIAAVLTPAQQGKLDVLDMDGWRLERHVFANGRIERKSTSLNNVLDYSGF